MTRVLLKKIKWLISILGLIGLVSISSVAIVSCSSSTSEQPKQEIVEEPSFSSFKEEFDYFFDKNIKPWYANIPNLPFGIVGGFSCNYFSEYQEAIKSLTMYYAKPSIYTSIDEIIEKARNNLYDNINMYTIPGDTIYFDFVEWLERSDLTVTEIVKILGLNKVPKYNPGILEHKNLSRSFKYQIVWTRNN